MSSRLTYRQIAIVLGLVVITVLVISAYGGGSFLSAAIFGGAGLQGGLGQAQGELAGSGLRGGTLLEGIGGIVRFILPLAFVGAFASFVIAGFFFILGFGSDTAIQRAKKIMTWSGAGLLVIAFSYVITQYVMNLATAPPAAPGEGVRGGELIQGIGGMVNFILPLAGVVAFVSLVIAGFFLILGFGSDTAIQRGKKIMIWSGAGLIVIAFSYVITQYVMNLATAPSATPGAGVRTGDLIGGIAGLVSFILPLAGVFAFISFVIAGFFFILGFGSETAVQRAKKIMIWSIVGLIVIAFSYVITQYVIDLALAPDAALGAGVRTGDLAPSILGVINFILSFAALAAFITFVVSGFTFILSFGSETAVQRAKKIMIWSIVGLFVIAFSFVITQFFVDLVSA